MKKAMIWLFLFLLMIVPALGLAEEEKPGSPATDAQVVTAASNVGDIQEQIKGLQKEIQDMQKEYDQTTAKQAQLKQKFAENIGAIKALQKLLKSAEPALSNGHAALAAPAERVTDGHNLSTNDPLKNDGNKK